MDHPVFRAEESSDISFLWNRKSFPDKTIFVLSISCKSAVMIELGPKNGWSDQIRKTIQRAKVAIRRLCNDN